jgi:SSS family solute:Na+ symporter
LLGPVDIAILAGFFLILGGLGFTARNPDSSVVQFLTAGRALSLPMFVATLVTSWYGGVLGIGESVSYYGIGTLVLLGVPYYLFAAIYAVVLAPKVREAPEYTIPEKLSSQWGNSTGLFAGVLVFLLAVPAAHVLMLGSLIQYFTNQSLLLSIFFAALLGTVFLYKGGLMADVRVGMLAFGFMYIGFAAMVGTCASRVKFDLVGAIQNSIPANIWGGQGPLAVISFFLLGAWTIVDPGFHQRAASAASPDLGRKGVLISIAFWFLFDLLTITTGLYAGEVLGTVQNPLLLFPQLAQAVLPSGIKGLFLCGLFGTIISALVGYSLVAGGSFGREIVSRLKPCTEVDTQKWIKLGIAMSSVLAAVLALTVQSVVALWYSWAGAVVGALLIPTVAAYLGFGTRWRPKAVQAAIGTSFTVAFLWMLEGIRTNNPFLMVRFAEQEFGLGTLIPGLAVSAIMIGWEGLVRSRSSKE